MHICPLVAVTEEEENTSFVAHSNCGLDAVDGVVVTGVGDFSQHTDGLSPRPFDFAGGSMD